MFYVDLIGDRTLTRNLDRFPDTVREVLAAKMNPIAHKVEQDVRNNILSRLSERSGNLLKALKSEVYDDGTTVVARVYIDEDKAPYAQGLEEGFTTQPHMIYPREAKVLAFIGATGDKVFASRVFHPGATVEGRHFFKDAYRENGPKISRDIKTAVVQGIRQNMRAGR